MEGDEYDSFYSGYEYVSTGWIDQEKISLTTINFTNQGNETVYNYEQQEGSWALTSVSVDYKAGTEISPSFGGNLSGDTILLSDDMKFTVTVGTDGNLSGIPDSAIAVLEGSTYQNRTGNGIQTGTLENVSIGINSSGLLSVSGTVVIQDYNIFTVAKGTGEGSENTEENREEQEGQEAQEAQEAPDASDTRAVIVENTNSYQVSNGTISLRDGQLVVLGEGATALSGSQLQSAFGLTTLSGEATYSVATGSWFVSDENSYFTFNNPESVSLNLTDSLNGLSVVNDDLDYNVRLSFISADSGLMLGSLLGGQEQGATITLQVDNESYTLGDGVTLSQNAQFTIGLDENNSLIFTAANDLDASYLLNDDCTVYDNDFNRMNISGSITATLNAGDIISADNLFTISGISYLVTEEEGVSSAYIVQNSTWITGVEISDNTINVLEGARGTQGSYSFTIGSTGSIDTWTDRVLDNSWSLTGSVLGYTVTTSLGVSFDKETGTFSGGSFDYETINENPSQYSVYDTSGAIIIGIHINIDEKIIETMDSSAFDYTENNVRYTGSLNAGYDISSWTDALQHDESNPDLLVGVTAYGTNPDFGDEVLFSQNNGILFRNGAFESDFSTDTINANRQNYGVRSENGA